VPVFPCRGKIAIVKDEGRRWGKTTDLAQIDRWWTTADYNIGVQPADMGLVGIDADLNKDEGVDPATLALLPATRTHRTGSGNKHFFYKSAEEFGNQKLARNVDIRSRNGYVIWPPSEGYSVEDDRQPVELPGIIRVMLKDRNDDSEPEACDDIGIDADPALTARAREWLQKIADDPATHPGRYQLAASLRATSGSVTPRSMSGAPSWRSARHPTTAAQAGPRRSPMCANTGMVSLVRASHSSSRQATATRASLTPILNLRRRRI
jgi:hypothetical protein